MTAWTPSSILLFLLYGRNSWRTRTRTLARPSASPFFVSTCFFALLVLTPCLLFQLHAKDMVRQKSRQNDQDAIQRLKLDQQFAERLFDPRMQLSLFLQRELSEAERTCLTSSSGDQNRLQLIHQRLRKKLAPISRLTPSLRWHMLEYKPFVSRIRIEPGYYWYTYHTGEDLAFDVEGFPYLWLALFLEQLATVCNHPAKIQTIDAARFPRFVRNFLPFFNIFPTLRLEDLRFVGGAGTRWRTISREETHLLLCALVMQSIAGTHSMCTELVHWFNHFGSQIMGGRNWDQFIERLVLESQGILIH